MDERFIRDRITQLRMERDISEYRMSLELGHSKGYIQSISSGRSLPSMSEFLAICEYLDITPAVFFTDPAESESKSPNGDSKEAAQTDDDAVYLKITHNQERILRELIDQII